MNITVVIPLYNEEESLPELHAWIQRVMNENHFSYEIIFINDGSQDRTLEVLHDLNMLNPNVHFISFSRNFGKEAALYAGLQHATGDYVTVMDVDLQDPPELLVKMKKKLARNLFLLLCQLVKPLKPSL